MIRNLILIVITAAVTAVAMRGDLTCRLEPGAVDRLYDDVRSRISSIDRPPATYPVGAWDPQPNVAPPEYRANGRPVPLHQ